MAGGKFSDALLHGMTIRESADDGSDFTNPAADYRRLFLGEDGLLHLKDSSGTVTSLGGSGIAATIFSAKGELIGSSANDTPSLIPAAAGDNDVLGAKAALTAGAGFLRHRFCFKTVGESFSSTSYADSTNMSMAIEASKNYKFRYVIFFETNAATVGIKLAIQGPASCQAWIGGYTPAAAPAAGGSAIYHIAVGSADISTDLTVAQATAGPGTQATLCILEGLLMNSTNAGTLKLRHASETATSTTIKEFSHGELWEIA